jgi:hypothetical protein
VDFVWLLVGVQRLQVPSGGGHRYQFDSRWGITPANRPEEEAAPALNADIEKQQRFIVELHCDCGYMSMST